MVSILIVDDQILLREALRTWLELGPELEVVGEAANGREALAQVELLHPDLVLMDVKMAGMDGLTATRELKKLFPKVHVLVFSISTDEQTRQEALEAGAIAFVPKTNANLLLDSIYYHFPSNAPGPLKGLAR